MATNFISYHAQIAEKIMSNPQVRKDRTLSFAQLDAILDMVGRFDITVDFETVTTVGTACSWMLATDRKIQAGEIKERQNMFRNRDLKAAFIAKWPSLYSAIQHR
jgi:hypothetical protein